MEAVPQTLAARERTALALLASAMFAEAHELPAEGDLARCLRGYVTQLLRPRVRRRADPMRDSYEIRDATESPVFRRLATAMEALALSLGPWSGVGRALANWASRINLAVAEAERRSVTLRDPSNELLAMAAALGADDGADPVRDALLDAHPELREEERGPEDQAGPQARPPRMGRVWIRTDPESGRRTRRR